MTVLVGRLASGMTPQQHRLAAQAGMAHTGALQSVTGVISGLAFAKTTGMSATIGVGQAWIAGGSAADQGGYTVTVDPAETVSFANGDATRDRIDLVVLEVKDNTFDASGLTLGRSRVVQGAYPVSGSPVVPAVPVSCVGVWTQRVNHGTNAGSGGIDTSLTVDVRIPTASLGTPIWVPDQTTRDALTATDGLAVYRMDLHLTERYSSAAAGWLRQAAPLPLPNLLHKPRRLLTRNTAFTLANNVITAVGTYVADTGDDGSACGITYSSPSFTVSQAGLYRVEYALVFPAGAGGSGIFRIIMYKNITAVGPPVVGTVINGMLVDSATSGEAVLGFSRSVVLAAGDTLTPAAFQNSGASLSVGGAVSAFGVFREDD